MVAAMIASVTDPEVGRIVSRLGGRRDGVHRLPGSLDQAVDSVDVLTNEELRRAAGQVLGLTAGGDAGS